MRPSKLAFFVFLMSAALTAQTREENFTRCAGSDPDVTIVGCTAVIQSVQETNYIRAIAFSYRGAAYYQKGDHNRAIQDFDQALRLNPNYAEAFSNRGNVYNDKGNYDQAIQDFDQALGLSPNLAYAYNGRGNAYNDKGNYDRAIQDFDQALRLSPNYAYAFNGRGTAYSGKGNYDRAIQDFDQALRLSANYVEALYNRGNAYNSKGNYDRAIQDYDQALRLNSNLAQALTNRGNAYNSKGNYDRAIQDYDQALRLDPNDTPYFFSRGVTQFCAGRFSAAEADLSKQVESHPTDSYAALWLYLARSRSGKDATAWLEAASQHLDANTWPAPVVRMFLGRATAQDVLAAAKESDADSDRAHLCQAYFYSGEQAILKQRSEEARNNMNKAIATCRAEAEADRSAFRSSVHTTKLSSTLMSGIRNRKLGTIDSGWSGASPGDCNIQNNLNPNRQIELLRKQNRIHKK